jgi:hypothetical protein
MGAKYHKERKRKRLALAALICGTILLITWTTRAPSQPAEPARFPCDVLFSEHDVKTPDDALDPLDALLDTNLLLSCVSILKHWRTSTLPVMRLTLSHEGGEDVQEVDGAQELKYSLRSADAAIRHMPAQGIVVVTSAAQAWPLIAALRARDDIDVAAAARNVDAALIVRRRNANPPSLERLDLRTLIQLEWPPAADILASLDLPRDAFPPPVEPSELIRWLAPSLRPFSAEAARAARDAAHWRSSCYAILATDGAAAARPCFGAHERHQQLWHASSAFDAVPLGLVAAAQGDVPAAVCALTSAYEMDPAATARLLERAAAAIAPAG